MFDAGEGRGLGRAAETRTAMGWEGVTYTVRGGDDDGTGDEGQAIVHAHLQGSFPATTRCPDALSMGCCEQQLESQTECLLPRGA